ncbi:glycosyl transferase [Bacteroidia bacterium]|nr:glycosyl transferase [Bacteroidia bacterium]
MKLSIITINFNNAEGLQKTIESVISQSFTDFEYIIIDGGSTDGSVDVIEAYADRITYWISEPDKGIYNAMNKGILQAKGEYCLFLNSGDFLYKDTVLQNAAAKMSDADVIYGNAFNVDNDKKIRSNILISSQLSMRNFYASSILHPATFIKKKLFESSLYDEQYHVISDWYFFVQKIIFENCTTQYLNMNISCVVPAGESLQNPIHWTERKKAMDVLLPQRIQKDYDTLQLYHNLKIDNLVDNYFHGKGIRKWIAYCIVKINLMYHLLCVTFKWNKN